MVGRAWIERELRLSELETYRAQDLPSWADGTPMLARRCKRVGVPILAAVWISVTPAMTRSAPPADRGALSAQLRSLVLSEDPSAPEALRRRVADGLPPGPLAATLDALRAHPRLDMLEVLHIASAHRRPAIRGRALAARAELGGRHAVQAIAAAADDWDAQIRLLAWALAQEHPSAPAEEIVARLLERDDALRAQVVPSPEGQEPSQ